MLPCRSDPRDEDDAAVIAKHFAIATTRVDLSATYDTLIVEAQNALDAVPEQTRGAPPADSQALLSLTEHKRNLPPIPEMD